MLRKCAFATLLAAVAVLVAAVSAGAYHTSFTSNCNNNTPPLITAITRDAAITYAYVAKNEGYQWGGGCWNNDDVDNSPGDPPATLGTNGEGGDCSGFTFKSWREADNTADAGFYAHPRWRNYHGSYDSSAFKAGAGAPNVTYGKSGLIKMDALASSTHIGMIYAKNADGTDQIIEAKGEAYGTNIWVRTYRGSSSYGGVRRLGWA